MKKLPSLKIRIVDDQDVLIFDSQTQKYKAIGLKNTRSEIITGIYHQESKEWESLPLSPGCYSLSDKEDYGTEGSITSLHIVFFAPLPSDISYLALQQKAAEKITAITPLFGLENGEFTLLETYFFDNQEDEEHR